MGTTYRFEKVIMAYPGTDKKNLVYEDTPRYDFWLKLIPGGVLSLLLTWSIRTRG